MCLVEDAQNTDQRQSVSPVRCSSHANDGALLTSLRRLVEFDVPLDELQESADAYVREVDQAVAKRPELAGYVKKLEERFDSAIAATGGIPSPEDMVEELEQYLKSQLPPPDQIDES